MLIERRTVFLTAHVSFNISHAMRMHALLCSAIINIIPVPCKYWFFCSAYLASPKLKRNHIILQRWRGCLPRQCFVSAMFSLSVTFGSVIFKKSVIKECDTASCPENKQEATKEMHWNENANWRNEKMVTDKNHWQKLFPRLGKEDCVLRLFNVWSEIWHKDI